MSMAECLVIMIVALVVFGPERLPELAQRVGRLVGHCQRVWQSLQAEILAELPTDVLQKNEDKAAQADKRYEHD